MAGQELFPAVASFQATAFFVDNLKHVTFLSVVLLNQSNLPHFSGSPSTFNNKLDF